LNRVPRMNVTHPMTCSIHDYNQSGNRVVSPGGSGVEIAVKKTHS
jgi:hypothetical protein